MNSKSLLTTVFRNLQCARRNRGYWPTMYMMFDAMIALGNMGFKILIFRLNKRILMVPFTLLSLPFFCSHNPSKSLMTVTRNRFSSLDGICQDIARLKDGQLQCMALASIRSPCDDSMKTSSCMEPEIDPIAQQRVFRFFQDHSLPFT